MRITFLTLTTVHGQTFAAGDASDLPDHLARNAVARGLALVGDVLVHVAGDAVGIDPFVPEPVAEPVAEPVQPKRRGRPRS